MIVVDSDACSPADAQGKLAAETDGDLSSTVASGS